MLDNSRGTTGGYGSSGTGQSGGYDSTGTGLGHSSTAGPHSSNLANKADPRVDSDLGKSSRLPRTVSDTYWSLSDGRGGVGGYGVGGAGNTLSTSRTGVGSGYDSTGTSTTGPHSSSLANKADPRVDSDRGELQRTTYKRVLSVTIL